MRSYKCLSKQVYKDGNYSIVPIRDEDCLLIMKWRNEQIYHLRQNKILTLKDQNLYFKDIINPLFCEEQPNQILFSYLENGDCIGYGGLVHISWKDRNAEVSFIMDTKLEEDDFEINWHRYLELIEEVTFLELKFHKMYIYAFDLRPHLYTALENYGFNKEAVLIDHTFIDGRYRNVVIHSKIRTYE